MLRTVARGLCGSLAASALALGTMTVTSQAETVQPAVGTQLVSNNAFSSGTTGWMITGKLAVSSVGQDGSPAAVVTSDKTQLVALTTSPRPVTSSVAGSVYDASAWVRTSRVGQHVRLLVREAAVGKAAVLHTVDVAMPDRNWHKLTLNAPIQTTGRALAVQVQGAGQRVGDTLTVDDVTMSLTSPGTTTPTTPTPTPPAPTTPTPTPTPTPTCTFSERGIPSSVCGPLLGSAFNSNTDPAVWEKELGRPLGVRRTYWGPTQVASAVAVAKADVAAHRIPWVSFKLPYSWSDMAAGKGDVWAKDLATRLAAVGGPVWVAFHHEPEGDGDMAAWKRMQEHLAPLVRGTAPNVAYTAILMGWHQISGEPQYSLATVWPDTKIDIAGFDPYNWYGTMKSSGVVDTKQVDMKKDYFDPISAWAASKGLAWAVAETGYTDAAHAVDPTWLPRTFAGLKADHGIAMSYFNTPLNSASTWTWVLGSAGKKAAFANTLARSPHIH